MDEPSKWTSRATCYSYDLLDNLTKVEHYTSGVKEAQNRSYVYDGLSRLTQATTPESGNLSTYFYYTTSTGALCAGDPNAVCRRTDARNITSMSRL